MGGLPDSQLMDFFREYLPLTNYKRQLISCHKQVEVKKINMFNKLFRSNDLLKNPIDKDLVGCGLYVMADCKHTIHHFRKNVYRDKDIKTGEVRTDVNGDRIPKKARTDTIDSAAYPIQTYLYKLVKRKEIDKFIKNQTRYPDSAPQRRTGYIFNHNNHNRFA